jgi:hypothetical protein
VFIPVLAMLANKHPDERQASDLVHPANHSDRESSPRSGTPTATNPTTHFPSYHTHRVDLELDSQMAGHCACRSPQRYWLERKRPRGAVGARALCSLKRWYRRKQKYQR